MRAAHIVILILFLHGYPDRVLAEDQAIETDKLAIETYIPPVAIKRATPKYPASYIGKGTEGWVRFHMMVDPQGKPYDITITDTSEDKLIEREALKAIRAFRFEPAMLNGEPIDAGVMQLITFELGGHQPGARPSFITLFKKLRKALTDNRQEDAQYLLSRMEKRDRNLYEQAFFNLGSFQYASLYGTHQEALHHLSKAVFMDHNRGYIDDDLLTDLLIRKMALEMKLLKVGAARQTADTIVQRELNDGQAESVAKVRQFIEDFAKSDKVAISQGRIPDDYHYYHRLVKNNFGFHEVEGRIAEMRIHCDRGYVGFAYRAEIRFSIKPDWSDCNLIVIGDPGASFKLIEG